MEKKYKFTDEQIITPDGDVLNRIEALRDISRWNVRAGDKGGFLDMEFNLNQEDDSWVGQKAMIRGVNSYVEGNILISGNAIVQNSRIRSDGVISGNVQVLYSNLSVDNLQLYNDACVEKCEIKGKKLYMNDSTKLKSLYSSEPIGELLLSEESSIMADSPISTMISGHETSIRMYDHSRLFNATWVQGEDITMSDRAQLVNRASLLGDNISLSDFVSVSGSVIIGNAVQLSEAVVVEIPASANKTLENIRLSGDFFVTELP